MRRSAPSHRRRHRRAALLVTAALAAGALAACSTSSSGADGSPGSAAGGTGADVGAFPVTMRHAHGTTTIEQAPRRVVTLGWGVADAALAVGVVPVAMEYQAYGTGADGIPSWTKKKLTAMGAATPTVLPKTTDEPAYDAILAARPDLILATSTGITTEQYDKLTAIAPTVAYTGKPFTTPWRTNVEQVATALGRTAEATKALTAIDGLIARQAAAHPELKGKTLAAVWDVGGVFYVYRKEDSRVGFMLDLGPTSAPSVDRLANGKETFYYTLSYEQTGRLDADIVVAYADTQQQLRQFLAKPSTKAIPAVRRGAVAPVVGTSTIAAVSPPTVLSLPDALPGLVKALAAAAATS